MGSTAFIVIAAVLSLVATILAFIFIIPDSKRASLNKLGQIVHDFLNFKYLIMEKILQFAYIFATAFIIIFGFFKLFSFYRVWGELKWYGGTGILLMLLGPIVIRIAYEFIMMAILLVKNVTEINRKLKGNSDAPENDVFSAPDYSSMFSNGSNPTPPSFSPPVQGCPYCGSALNPDGSCPYCNH